MAASPEQLKALRKKYGLGEFRKNGKTAQIPMRTRARPRTRVRRRARSRAREEIISAVRPDAAGGGSVRVLHFVGKGGKGGGGYPNVAATPADVPYRVPATAGTPIAEPGTPPDNGEPEVEP